MHSRSATQSQRATTATALLGVCAMMMALACVHASSVSAQQPAQPRTIEVAGTLRPANAAAATAMDGAVVEAATFEFATETFNDFAQVATVTADGKFHGTLSVPTGALDLYLRVDIDGIPHLARGEVEPGATRVDLDFDVYAGEPGPGSCALLGELIDVETFEMGGAIYLNLRWLWFIGNVEQNARLAEANATDDVDVLVRIDILEPAGSQRTSMPPRYDGSHQPPPRAAQTQPAISALSATELARLNGPFSVAREPIMSVDTARGGSALRVTTPLLPGITAVQVRNDFVKLESGNAGTLSRALSVAIAPGAKTVVRLQAGTVLDPTIHATATAVDATGALAWDAAASQAFSLIVQQPGPSPMGGGANAAADGAGAPAMGMPGTAGTMGAGDTEAATDDTDRSLPGFPWFAAVAGACTVWIFVVVIARVRRRESPDLADPSALDTARLQQLVRDLHAKPEGFGLTQDDLAKTREALVSELARRRVGAH